VKATGYPAPTYQWFFNGERLNRQSRNVLIIRHVKPQHAGEYSVTASNRSGRVGSTAALTVFGVDGQPASQP